MKPTFIISNSKNDVNLEKSLSNVKGKRVLGKSGEVVGVVKDIIINANSIDGIILKHRGRKVFLQHQYIDQLFNESVMLKIDPVTRYLGMIVFDSEGRNLGKVVDVHRSDHTNSIEKLVIRKGWFGKQKTVKSVDIEISNKNIILKTALKDG